MSDKTLPISKTTKLGILSIQEIEQIIFDNLILVQSYIYRNHETLEINIDTLLHIHQLLCSNLFDGAGIYRKHDVQVGTFEPIRHSEVHIEMKKLGDDITYRISLLHTASDKKEFLAYTLRKILRIHPFFDYNARVTRLFGELILLKLNLPLKSFRGKTRSEFAEAMKKATFEKDLSGVLQLL